MGFKYIKSILSPKTYYLSGSEAVAEGAIAAGCRFFASYPITPATDIAEFFSMKSKDVEAIFIQMEDEIASICSMIGASWAGAKAMTATSGPGFSLMQEAIVIDECGGDLRVAVGTPAELGGLPYDELGVTGYGAAEVTEVGTDHLGLDFKTSTMAIQGFGAAGSFTAKFLHEKGAKKIVALSSIAGAIYDPNGLDIEKLLELKEKFGDNAVKEYSGAKSIPLGDELKLDVDILIPAAIGDVITKENDCRGSQFLSHSRVPRNLTQ